MTASEILTQAWASVGAEGHREGTFIRLLPLPGRLAVSAGLHLPSGARVIVLDAERRALRGHALQDETRGYIVEVRQDEAGRTDHSSIFVSQRLPGDGRIFEGFCADLLEQWTSHEDAGQAVGAVAVRLAQWRTFFQRQEGMDRNWYIGLYGELSFMEDALRAGIPGAILVQAWQGMHRTNQDYLFGPSAVEVKTVTSNDANRIRITNPRQLDPTGLQRLLLCRYAFDLRQGSGRGLREIVSELRTAIARCGAATAGMLDDRLLEAGFSDAVPNELDGWGFSRRSLDAFQVGDGFPCIREGMVPPGISELSYTIDLSAAGACRIGIPEIWSSGLSGDV